jgi:hypothetical protein
VFVLTDDLSANLLRFMPTVRAMDRHGCHGGAACWAATHAGG